MKTLLIISIVAMMSWEPSCDSTRNPTSSSRDNGHTSYYHEPTQYRMLVNGTIVDGVTNEAIDSVTVCRQGSCYVTTSKWYSFYVTTTELPYELQINVSHPNYLPDSAVVTLQRGVTTTHNFRLRRKS